MFPKNRANFLSLCAAAAVLLLASALTTALALAQEGGGPDAPASPQWENSGFSLPVQGRLTDAHGNPLSGNYDLTFRIYETASGGAPLCQDTNANVAVANGLFNTLIWGDCQDIFKGQQLYLGIEIEADGEMTPRQAIYQVPYAMSLLPGAVISGTVGSSPVLALETSSSSGRGLRSYATSSSGTNYAVVGASKSPAGYGGFFYNSGGGVGLWGYGDSTDKPAILGCMSSNSSNCSVSTNASGVIGTSSYGDGIQGFTSDILSRGVYAENTGAGTALTANSNSTDTTNHTRPTLYLMQTNATGDYVVGARSYLGTRDWRVDRTGKGYFNGGTQASGADFAEQIAVKGSQSAYSAGDVLVISASADRTVEKSSRPFSTAVIGVYSSDPAVLAGAPDRDGPLAGVPVAVVGIVPCNASAENGPIQRGDLLVTAGLPGYAMRAGDNPPQGTVLGKALQALPAGTGVILILVGLQ